MRDSAKTGKVGLEPTTKRFGGVRSALELLP
jgi:hypothetical protein